MPQNLVQMNRWLHKQGMPADIELVKNHELDYFYFFGDACAEWKGGTMVEVAKLNHLTPGRWLERYQALSGDTLQVTKTNLMSGQEYQEAKGTPNFCSPASEAYWSM